jgi:hypothetical protein
LLLTLRTFSKIYGSPGVRVGYGVGPLEVIEVLNRIRQPFNVNALAQVAALAALDDQAHVERTRANNREGLAYLRGVCEKLRRAYVPSWANFLLIDVGDGARVYDALLRPRCHRAADGRLRLPAPLARHRRGRRQRTSASPESLAAVLDTAGAMTRVADRLLIAGVGLIGWLARPGAPRARRRRRDRRSRALARRTSASRAGAARSTAASAIRRAPARDVDLVVVATPVGTIAPLVATLATSLPPTAVITDAAASRRRRRRPSSARSDDRRPVLRQPPDRRHRARRGRGGRARPARRSALHPHADRARRRHGAPRVTRALGRGRHARRGARGGASRRLYALVSHLPQTSRPRS